MPGVAFWGYLAKFEHAIVVHGYLLQFVLVQQAIPGAGVVVVEAFAVKDGTPSAVNVYGAVFLKGARYRASSGGKVNRSRSRPGSSWMTPPSGNPAGYPASVHVAGQTNSL